MEKRCHSRMMLGQFWLLMRTSFVAVTKPSGRMEILGRLRVHLLFIRDCTYWYAALIGLRSLLR